MTCQRGLIACPDGHVKMDRRNFAECKPDRFALQSLGGMTSAARRYGYKLERYRRKSEDFLYQIAFGRIAIDTPDPTVDGRWCRPGRRDWSAARATIGPY
jgi:hypothetical protein